MKAGFIKEQWAGASPNRCVGGGSRKNGPDAAICGNVSLNDGRQGIKPKVTQDAAGGVHVMGHPLPINSWGRFDSAADDPIIRVHPGM